MLQLRGISLSLWFSLCLLIIGVWVLSHPQVENQHSALPEKGASRVIVYPMILSSLISIDDGSSHILAAQDLARNLLLESPLANIYPMARNIIEAHTIGGKSAVPSDPEQALLIGSDAVVILGGLGDELEKLGLPLVRVEKQSVTDEDEIALWHLLGRLMARDARVGLLVSNYRDEIELLMREVEQARLVSPGTRKVLVLWGENGAYFVATRPFQLAHDVRRLGAINLGDSQFRPRTDLEGVLSYSPDLLFIPNWGTENEERENLFSSLVLASLPAVRQGRVYLLPSAMTRSRGLIDQPLMLRWMAELMYPNLHPALRNLVKAKYLSVFGYAVSDADLDRILLLNENASSANYDQFKAPVSH